MQHLEQAAASPASRFVHLAGHDLPLRVSVLTLKRVRDETGARLDRAMLDQEEHAKVFGDPVAMLGVLAVVAEKRLAELGVTRDELLESATADEIDAARVPLMRAVVDFLPRREVREVLHRVIDDAVRESDAEIAAAVRDLLAPATPEAPATTEEVPAE